MKKLTAKQNEVLEEIAYDFIYKRDGYGYSRQAPEGGAHLKASIAVKSLIAPSVGLIVALPSEDGRIFLTSDGWNAFIDGGNYAPPAGSEHERLTKLADHRITEIREMLGGN